MADNDETVRLIRVQGRPEGLDKLAAELRKVQEAQTGVAQAGDAAAAATERSARRQLSALNAWERQAARADSAFKAQQQFDRELGVAARAFDQGIVGAQRYAQEIERLQRQLERAGSAAAKGSPALESALGLRPAASGSAAASGAVFQEAFNAQDEQARNIQKLRQQYDPLGVAQDRYASAIAETNKLLQAGAISEAQHLTITTNARKVLEDTTKAYNGAFVAQGKYATGAGLARHELVNLSRQLQDVGVSLASGQSPLTVLIQQGTQIADVFAASRASMSGFFAQAARGIAGLAMSGAGLLTGAALVGGAAIVAGYQYAESQRAVERAMAGVGRQSGITAEQIERASAAYSDAAKTSTATAREIIAAYASTGKIDAGVIFGSGGLTRDFAAFSSTTTTDAAKALASAFVDPTRGAQELNKQIGFLDAKTLDYIRTAQAQGRIGEAQKVLAETLGRSVQGAAERTSGLARAWDAVWNAASKAWDAVGKAVAGQISLEERLAKLIEARRQAEGRRSRSASASALAEYDAGITDLQEQIRRQNQQLDRETRAARENAASTGALSVIDELNPFATELRRLQTMASALKKGLEEAGSALNPEQARQVAEAYDRVQKAIQTALPPAERQKQLNDNAVQSIMARTLAERTAAEVARLQLDSAFRLKETEEQRLIVLGKINEMQAQANREARDALRSSKDQLELSTLRPYQRRIREIELQERDNRERFGGAAAVNGAYGAGGYTGEGPFLNGTSALPATTGVLRNMDAAFAANLRRAMNDIPGLTITSGWRSMERQAQLQREKPGWAASPTGSNHPKGLAADLAYNGSGQLPPSLRARLEQEYGLSFPLANRAVRPEPWHAEPAGGRSRAAGPMGDAAAAGISENARATAANENYNAVIRASRDELAQQEAALKLQGEAYNRSTYEVAEAAKRQELYNQFAREGREVTPDLAREIDDLAAGYGRLAAAAEQTKIFNDVLRETQDIGASALKGFISDLRAGKSGAEAFANALNRIADKLIDTLADGLFGKGILGNLFGSGGGLFGSLSKGAFGFADGGYTGRGGKHDFAGFVHRDEFVFSKEATQRLGANNLDRLHRGVLKGYDAGGLVGPSTNYSAMPAPYIHEIPAANSNQPVPVSLSVDVRGATGNQEVQAMVAAGVSAGMAQVQRQIGRNISTIATQQNQRFVR